MSRPRHEQQQQQQQKQQQHLGSSGSGGGVGVVTESVAFKLVCDMQHLRGKVDLMCSLGATLAQRWVEEVVHQQQQQHKHRQAVESRLRSEMEDLALELVDVSVEIQRMKERKELAQRFFYLAERRRSWCQVYDDEEDEDVATSSRKAGEGGAKAMMQLIDLDECDQVIDKLTTLLLGYLTAGEREEEEHALRVKFHLDMSAADAFMRQPISSGPPLAGLMRLHNHEHDDNLLR
jgi:hypothetical protein